MPTRIYDIQQRIFDIDRNRKLNHVSGNLSPIQQKAMDVGTTVVTLNYDQALFSFIKAIISIEPNGSATNLDELVRYTDDGKTNPNNTTKVGHILGNGFYEIIGLEAVSNFRIRSLDGLTHKMNVTFYADQIFDRFSNPVLMTEPVPPPPAS